MPEIEMLKAAAIAVAVLMIVLFCFTWVVTHPLVIVAVIGAFIAIGSYSRRRNRV